MPYALKDYEGYTNKVKSAFKKFNLKYSVSGIHEKSDPVQAINQTDCIFIGGGNTFLLLKTLYDLKLQDVIRNRVLKVNSSPNYIKEIEFSINISRTCLWF